MEEETEKTSGDDESGERELTPEEQGATAEKARMAAEFLFNELGKHDARAKRIRERHRKLLFKP